MAEKTLPYSDPAEILDSLLFLGTSQAAKRSEELVRLNVKYIINTTKEIKNYFPEKFEYLKLDLEDESTEQVSLLFPKCIEFIEKAKKEGKAVLVHCQAGISRSSTIVIAYLVGTKQYNLKSAFELVRSKKYNIGPNEGYMNQLMEYEKLIFGTVSLNIKEYYAQALHSMGFEYDKSLKAVENANGRFETALTLVLGDM